MHIEKQIIRWVLVVPALLLALFFLPVRHGSGCQFGGILDRDFLCSGAIDYLALGLEILLILLLGFLLEYVLEVISSRL